jgi:hypothetical protein
MTDQHPITPPPELALQWINEYLNEHPEGVDVEVLVVSAAQWGADQELEACCEWLMTNRQVLSASALGAARRPNPPSLKEQALEMLENAWEGGHINNNAAQTIRRALEQLHD